MMAEYVAQDRVYSLFGLLLASDFPFASRLTVQSSFDAPASSIDGVPQVEFHCVDVPPYQVDWASAQPIYTSSSHLATGEPAFSCYRIGDCDVLRFTRVVDYYLERDRIWCHMSEHATRPLVEIHVLGAVISWWLEGAGVPILHASAVAVEGGAVAFLSGNRGGKSGLAATFMQAGHPLLSDDILPIQAGSGTCQGLPGYPSMRMWPDEADHFFGDHAALPPVSPALTKRRVTVGEGGFGTFCGVPQALRCLYLPERQNPAEAGGEIRIVPLTRSQALIALVRHSFLQRLVEAAGLQRGRLAVFAQVAQRVPMRRLLYPSGFEHLPAVRERVLADLAGLAPSADHDWGSGVRATRP